MCSFTTPSINAACCLASSGAISPLPILRKTPWNSDRSSFMMRNFTQSPSLPGAGCRRSSVSSFVFISQIYLQRRQRQTNFPLNELYSIFILLHPHFGQSGLSLNSLIVKPTPRPLRVLIWQHRHILGMFRLLVHKLAAPAPTLRQWRGETKCPLARMQ